MTRLERHARLILLCILLVAAALRVPGLDRVPPPLNQDEASRGYDAWSILETGADRHGRRWPLFLESFGPGDYTAALSTYLTVPFVAALGPSVVAMRLPAALLGVATVGLMYGWLRRRGGVRIALAASAILALDPWHVALTRTAHESAFAPFLMVVALLALCRAGLMPGAGDADCRDPSDVAGTGRTAAAWASLAGFMLAMHTWVYPATRLFTPLFCAALLVMDRRRFAALVRHGRGRRTVTAAGAGVLIGAVPLFITLVNHPERLAARAGATVTLLGNQPAASAVADLVRNFARNVDPRYLFVQCDEMSGATTPDVGQHLLALAPFLLIGLFRLAANFRSDAWSRLLIVWLLLYPIPAAVCGDWNPHPMRTVGGMLWFPVVAATGLDWAARRVGSGSGARRRVAGVFVTAAVLANVGHFVRSYLGRFPTGAEPAYQTALIRAIEYAGKRVDDVDFVLVTNRSVQPYIYALLQDAIGPGRRPRLVVAEGRRGFHQVLRFGKFYFAPSDVSQSSDALAMWKATWGAVPAGAVGLVIERANIEAPGELLATFEAGDGSNRSENYQIRRWRVGGP